MGNGVSDCSLHLITLYIITCVSLAFGVVLAALAAFGQGAPAVPAYLTFLLIGILGAHTSDIFRAYAHRIAALEAKSKEDASSHQ